jgi:hypothetical protein
LEKIINYAGGTASLLFLVINWSAVYFVVDAFETMPTYSVSSFEGVGTIKC